MAIGFGPGRVYPTISGRQQGADRLVYNEGDFRRVLAEAARTAEAATIRLGGDIFITTPIVLPATTFDLLVEGAGKYGFRCASGFSATEMFRVGPGIGSLLSGILFHGLTFEAPPVKLARLVAARSTTFSVSWVDCTLERIERIVQPLSGSVAWRDSTFENLRFTGLTISDVTDIGTADFDRCLFFRCYGMGFVGSPTTVRQVAIDSISGSTSMVAIDAGPPALGGYVYLTSGLGQSVINRLLVAGALDVGGNTTLGQALVHTPIASTLSAASPNLDPTNTMHARVAIGAGAAFDIFILDGVDAQVLKIEIVSLGSAATLQDSTALSNCRLVGNWVPTVRSSITLTYNASDASWWENARAIV